VISHDAQCTRICDVTLTALQTGRRSMKKRRTRGTDAGAIHEDDPLWFKDAIIYEVHVRSFFDSNGDGIGDLRGFREKLDYLQDLGITAVWLLPFYPSPLRDDGYDISDYRGVHPDYGTLKDFREVVREAHRRGIRVITELVLNHTSDRHPWFQQSRLAPKGSAKRDVYVWSDTPEKYREARIIFSDFESSNWSWDPVARAYYWHRFYAHQPDLNYDNPQIRRDMLRTLDFWLGMGVDGLRLDAVPYLFEREGTGCENLKETYDYLRELRAHVDRRFPGRLLLAEANQWPEDAAAYLGSNDMCHMAFHFPLMPRIFMAVQMEDRFPIVDILEQTPTIPEACQWALFLRNHDELTLEMVSDEERDTMVRFFAGDPRAKINLGIRRRLAPLLNNSRRKIELLNLLLFTLPGTPIIYYGDEIGMGDNYYLGDRNGVRTPMQWSADRNAGFSDANSQKLYLPVIIDPEYHYEAVNVENQQSNLSSLLWWMKRMITIRKQFKAFGRGSLAFVPSDNARVLTFIRSDGEDAVLVVANLSRFSQPLQLDLSAHAGIAPQDLFSRNRFPVIRESPYMLTVGPHGTYLFLLQKEKGAADLRSDDAPPEIDVDGPPGELLEGRPLEQLLESAFPSYLRMCAGFKGAERTLRGMRRLDTIVIPNGGGTAGLLLVEASFTQGLPDVYLLPVSWAAGGAAEEITRHHPGAVIARLNAGGDKGILYDGVHDPQLRRALLELFSGRRRIRTGRGELGAHPGKNFRQLAGDPAAAAASAVYRSQPSGTSIVYGGRLFLKLYRRLEEGIDPDAEMAAVLCEKLKFPGVPPFAGTLEYTRAGAQPVTVGLMQGYAESGGEGAKYALDAATDFFEAVLARRELVDAGPPALPPSFAEGASSPVPWHVIEVMGGIFLEMTSILGRRTAEMHAALASTGGDPAFEPEPFSTLYQRAVFQSVRSSVRRAMQSLRRAIGQLPDGAREEALELLAREGEILGRIKGLLGKKLAAWRTRIHGDYGLRQVLYTGKDFFIVDFKGDPASSFSDRRIKRSPLRDVASMMRSFNGCAYEILLGHSAVRAEDTARLEPWADLWAFYTGQNFLNAYLAAAQDEKRLLPATRSETIMLLDVFIFEKAALELSRALEENPAWAIVPIRAILHALEPRGL
jgi:maltose alpha-D-glucosyltransferase/alpha-amylase